jgi:phenylalanyl-tRNA synthetase beta chain
VLNPLSQEESFLRSDLLTGLVRRVEHNWRHMVRDVRLFEIGTAFEKRGAGLPHEELRVAAVVSGARRPPHWSEPAPPDYDLFDVKALLEELLPVAHPGARIEPSGEGYVARGRSGAEVGGARPLAADAPAWAAPVLGCEVTLEPAEAAAARTTPLTRSPAVERDVALVLPPALSAAEVEASLRDGAGPLLERLWVFDQYRGPSLGAGRRSVAWRLVFREEGRTLREAEVDAALARSLALVEERHGVRRREA